MDRNQTKMFLDWAGLKGAQLDHWATSTFPSPENVDVMRAFAEGKEVEYFKGGQWHKMDSLMFNEPRNRYRVSKYAPFDHVSICLVGKQIVIDKEGHKRTIDTWNKDEVVLEDKNGFTRVSYSALLSDYKFAKSDKPCGLMFVDV